jgi:hypothetical protein
VEELTRSLGFLFLGVWLLFRTNRDRGPGIVLLLVGLLILLLK